jgi:hypothetical protein
MTKYGMKGIIRKEVLNNGYIIVIQDQHIHYNSKTVIQKLMHALGRPVIVIHKLIRYKVIVLVDGSYLEAKGIYGIASDINCETLSEANKILDKYIKEYQDKSL